MKVQLSQCMKGLALCVQHDAGRRVGGSQASPSLLHKITVHPVGWGCSLHSMHHLSRTQLNAGGTQVLRPYTPKIKKKKKREFE